MVYVPQELDHHFASQDVYKRQRFYWERVEASRNFANKVWNASRFIMMNLEKAEVPAEIDLNTLTGADKWILSKVNKLAEEVTENQDKYELGIAVQKVYDFILSLIHI